MAFAEFEAGGKANEPSEPGSLVKIYGHHVRDAIEPIREFARYRKDREHEVEHAAQQRGAR